VRDEVALEERGLTEHLLPRGLVHSADGRWALEHVPAMMPEARSVKAADKLHNLSCLLADLRNGDDVTVIWKRFRGGRERTLEMSGALVEALAPLVDSRLGRALVGVMEELRRF